MDQVTPGILRQRLRDYTYTSYIQSVFLIQNGVFVTAAAVFIYIFAQKNLGEVIHLGILWLASFFLSLIPLMTWTRGALLTNADFRLGDSVYPFIFGMAEFCLFVFLSPALGIYVVTDPNGGSHTDLSHLANFWYVAVSAHAWSAVGLITQRIRAGGIETFHHTLHELGVDYMTGMKRDRLRAAGSATFFSGVWVASLFFSPRPWWVFVDYATAVILIVISVGICTAAEAEYKRIRDVTFSVVE